MLAAILLGSIRVPYDELKRRILEIDEDNLTTAVIDQLIKYMPSSEQLSQLTALKDEYDQLTESEQFTIQMSAIKRIVPRLNSMGFKMKFPELVTEIKPVCSVVYLIFHKQKVYRSYSSIITCYTVYRTL